jgi:hypothetical protein
MTRRAFGARLRFLQSLEFALVALPVGDIVVGAMREALDLFVTELSDHLGASCKTPLRVTCCAAPFALWERF